MVQKWSNALASFSETFSGELHLDITYRTLFATDASVYREMPVAVVIIHTELELKQVVDFCVTQLIPIVLRGAGTSLGGQVVGNGLVVDISHLNKILAVNSQESWVDVEPGVVLDELNLHLKAFNLFFGPETSTSSRCTIGGMVGNNSCGARSLVYGSTRDQLVQVKGYLSNGSEVLFEALTKSEISAKQTLQTLEGKIYREIDSLLESDEVRANIIAQFPDSSIHRRNSGYALDVLAQSTLFYPTGEPLNLSKLIAGSEGTLMIITKIRLHLEPLPPKHNRLVIAHFNSLQEALEANVIIVKNFNPRAVELMDKRLLDLTKENVEQRRNRFFIQGDPQALLIIEVASEDENSVLLLANSITNGLINRMLGYAYRTIDGSDIAKVWSLRKAGLGVLSNMAGDAKPVSVIEDCAVRVDDLPLFCADITSLLKRYGKECVFHGHAGSGELHLRPILNLKDASDVHLFREIARETAILVKKYRGSLSGEHGDGRVRGEFIPLMVGDENYQLLCNVKTLFDPITLLNPNKIVATPPMNSSLRYNTQENTNEFKPILNWSSDGTMLRAVERCNGSADCIKSSLMKGAMCPSYQATKEEFLSPRGRANLIREYLSENGVFPQQSVKLQEVVDSLKLCLSCKACKSECPSNVDIAKLKVELLSLYQKENGYSLRSRIFLNFGNLSRFFSYSPRVYNWIISRSIIKYMLSNILLIAPQRTLPQLSMRSLQKISSRLAKRNSNASSTAKKVALFNDEFTNHYTSSVGEKAILLLQKLGYEVELFSVRESSRTALSMGNLVRAKQIINKNMEMMSPFVREKMPIIGLEPSAILTFRDEALDLATTENIHLATSLRSLCVTFEEFIASEHENGAIRREQFTQEKREICFHGHCYQKALEKPDVIQQILSIPQNYKVSEINSGCCGMGGAFGYEKEHYQTSTQVAELILLPMVRSLNSNVTVVTSGFSCKHQIEDLSDRKVMHPAEILYDAVKK